MTNTEGASRPYTGTQTVILFVVIALWFSHIYLLNFVPQGFVFGVPLWLLASYVLGMVTIGLIYIYLFGGGDRND